MDFTLGLADAFFFAVFQLVPGCRGKQGAACPVLLQRDRFQLRCRWVRSEGAHRRGEPPDGGGRAARFGAVFAAEVFRPLFHRGAAARQQSRGNCDQRHQMERSRRGSHRQTLSRGGREGYRHADARRETVRPTSRASGPSSTIPSGRRSTGREAAEATARRSDSTPPTPRRRARRRCERCTSPVETATCARRVSQQQRPEGQRADVHLELAEGYPRLLDQSLGCRPAPAPARGPARALLPPGAGSSRCPPAALRAGGTPPRAGACRPPDGPPTTSTRPTTSPAHPTSGRAGPRPRTRSSPRRSAPCR